MIRIQQLKLDTAHTKEALVELILKKLNIKRQELVSWEIVRKSVDARKKPNLKFVYTIDAEVVDPDKTVKKAKNPSIQMVEKKSYIMPQPGIEPLATRPVIAGFGPAGIFCGLVLARAGYRPLILERGETVLDRQQKVETFWETGALDERSNVQFGEGGAGTFSDGKLNTAVKDPLGRGRFVLENFVKAGAPEEILWQNKPHVGTDVLCSVVSNMRKEILRLGGEVRFLSQVTDLQIKDKHLRGIEINHQEILPCQVLIMAIGHSARDTFKMLAKKPLDMKAKPFAVGVRIEHPQEMIDFSQYGRKRSQELPAADYKLTRQLSNGRGVYSFCMCPGGYVVNASSEPGKLAVNGMSYHSRSGMNANSAMVVTVSYADFGGSDVLRGVEFQRKLEKNAFMAGHGKIPVQLFGDFYQGTVTKSLGDVMPNIKGSYTFGALHECFPAEIYHSLRDGIRECGSIIKGFDRTDAVLCGVESRTSSPLRIERGSSFESSISGLYPCGEGAGYAGGITSAAMDGIKTAEAVIKKYLPSKDGDF